ncbi:AAA family ATPase [Corynebacterium incognita]|uniref:AAA family ATPase n=1 Tax=Corynebacterium incognita TaxID=2754725 RepID=A0A7G7CP42_9CORY|nr:AAA family ATPase [Corynebacterium incognita]QNE89358.1 AAA family ATPase [Corynebacterium incognita]
MKLHSIEIENMRSIERLRLDDIPDNGVLVISGPNESGKSTIAEAINLVLNTKHTTKHKDVMAMGTVGKDAPLTVRLEATVGPYRFTVLKQFLKQRKCELTITAPQRRELRGEEAHDELQRILDEYVDASLRETLFMRQDDLNDGIAAAGIPSVSAALGEAARVSTAVDDPRDSESQVELGQHDTELFQEVERRYFQFFSKTGKPVKEYAKAQDNLEQAENALEEARRSVAELEGDVEAHREQSLRLESARRSLPEAQREYEAYSVELDALEAVERKLELAINQVSRQEALRDNAAAKVAERRHLRDVLAEKEAAVVAIEEKFPALKERATVEENTITALNKELEEKRGAVDSAKAARKEAAAAVHLAQNRDRAAQLRDTLQAIDGIDADMAAAQEKLAALAPRVKDKDVDTAEQLRNTADQLRERISASAAKLRVTSTGEDTLNVDGVEHVVSVSGDELVVELGAGTEITVGSLRAVFDPGRTARELEKDRAERTRVEEEFAQLIERFGVESLAELRQQKREQDELEQEINGLKRQRAAVVSTLRGSDSSQADVAALRAELKAIEAAIEQHQEVATSSGEELTLDAARRALDEAEQAVDDAAAAVDAVGAQLEPWQARKATIALSEANAQRAGVIEAREEARQVLNTAVESNSDEDLNTAVEEAEASLAAACRERDTQRAVLEEKDVEQLRRRATAAETAVATHKETIENAALKLAGLEARISHAAGAEEELQRAEMRVEQFSAEAASLERQARAVKLLRETLVRHRDAARARYAAPFVSRLAGLASVVFGKGVNFELDDELNVVSRTKDGRTVELGALSGGAKEQLRMLTRFAIADLVADSSSTDQESNSRRIGGREPVPVIVDDALGSTDTGRLLDMAAVFNAVGANNQVVVFTCVPERYSGVRDKTERSMRELKLA